MVAPNTDVSIAVVGGGSIGGVVAALLRSRGLDVELVCRREEQAEKIRTGGLAIRGPLGSYRVALPAVSTVEALSGTKDIVFLATKAQDMLEPARRLLPMLGPKSVVVSLQNGVSVDPLAEVVGRGRLVGCVVGWGSTMENDESIRVSSRGSFVIGRLDGSHDPGLELTRELLSQIVSTRITNNIYGALFSKLMFNACANSVGAATGLPLGAMLRLEGVPRLFRRILAEATAVAAAAGITIEPYSGQFNLMRLLTADGPFAAFLRGFLALLLGAFGYGNVRSSTLQSLDRGRTTEVDWLNGYIVGLGGRHGVDTPVNRRMVEVVKEIEQGRRPMSPGNLAEILKTI